MNERRSGFIVHSMDSKCRLWHADFEPCPGSLRCFLLGKQFYSDRASIYPYVYSYFEKGCRKKCAREKSRKVIWDMINTLFLTTGAVEHTFVTSFSTRKHMSVASRAIFSNLFEEQSTQNHPQYLSGLSSAFFPTTFLEIAVNGYRRDASFLHLRFTWVPRFPPALSKQLSHRPLCWPLFCSYQYNWRQFLWYRQKSFKTDQR